MTSINTRSLIEHVPRMYRVAARILDDADWSSDVVQEACARALAALDEFSGEASLATWLHRITVNCAMDAIKSRRRQQERLAAGAGGQGRSGGTAESAAAVAERNEMFGIARDLLDQLPDDCRTAFVLTQLDGYSYDEAARIENQPRGTIASRVFRAKQILLVQMRAMTEGRKPQ